MSNLCSYNCRCNGSTYTIWYECTGLIGGGRDMCRQFCKMASDYAAPIGNVGQAVAVQLPMGTVTVVRQPDSYRSTDTDEGVSTAKPRYGIIVLFLLGIGALSAWMYKRHRKK